MKTSSLNRRIALAVAACTALGGHAAFAADRVEVRGQLSFQYIDENERDLGGGRDNSLSEQAQLSVKAKLAEDSTIFVNTRALNVEGTAGFDDDTGRTIARDQSFLELRELWFRQDN